MCCKVPTPVTPPWGTSVFPFERPRPASPQHFPPKPLVPPVPWGTAAASPCALRAVLPPPQRYPHPPQHYPHLGVTPSQRCPSRTSTSPQCPLFPLSWRHPWSRRHHPSPAQWPARPSKPLLCFLPRPPASGTHQGLQRLLSHTGCSIFAPPSWKQPAGSGVSRSLAEANFLVSRSNPTALHRHSHLCHHAAANRYLETVQNLPRNCPDFTYSH